MSNNIATQSIEIRHNITRTGIGSPMLFVNGYGCDQSIWRFIWPEFEKSHETILFDHVGTGDSDRGAYDYQKYSDLQGYADDIIEICSQLNLRDVVIVGHSVGCMMATLAVNKKPTIFSKVILVSPSPCYINDSTYVGGFERADIEEMIDTLESNYLGWASSITSVIVGNPDQPQFTEELSNRFCSNDPEIARHFARTTFMSDNREDVKLLKKPTLAIQVTDDVIAPLSVGEYLRHNISDSELHLVNANGHCPHLTHPNETVGAIRQFLNLQ